MIDTGLHDNQIMIRNSMKKFDLGTRPFPELWLCDHSRPYSYGHLNKQFIMLLSGLGVKDSVLLSKQEEHFQRIEEMVFNPEVAVMMLQWNNQPDLAVTIAKYSREQFQSNKCLRRELIKLKSKLCEKLEKLSILIPESRTVFGVCDPHEVLEYGECFFRPTISGNPCTLSGYVIVSKNPCYLLGDVRCLKAISDRRRTEKLEYLVDCIVFPTKGHQPHSNEIAGSDLDGDQYFVCWDKDLIVTKCVKPYNYPASVSTKSTPHTSSLEYFACQGNQSATMGKIDKFYKVWANRKGIGCKECEELGKHFSHSVDSAKTGVKVTIPKNLVPPKEEQEREQQWVWMKMEEAARAVKEKLKESITSESDQESVTEDFVWSLLEDDNFNMSEYQLFNFIKQWCYHQAENGARAKLLEFSDYIDFSKFTVDQQVAAIDVGIPKHIVCNAMHKSQLLTSSMQTHFSLNSPHFGWKFYFRVYSDQFKGHHLLRALSKYPQIIVILQLHNQVTVALHFLTQLECGVNKLPAGSVVAYFFSQHFNFNQKYILGPEYTVDLDEEMMQIYRGEKQATFIKLAFEENEISKYSISVKNASEQISVDLTRFMPDVLTKYQHPKVRKESVHCFEVFVKTTDHKPAHFDIYLTDYNGELLEQVEDTPVEEIPLPHQDNEEEHNEIDIETPYCRDLVLKELNISGQRGNLNYFYTILQFILSNEDNIDNIVREIGSSFLILLNTMITNSDQNTPREEIEDCLQLILVAMLDITQHPLHQFHILDCLFRLQFSSLASQILQRMKPLSPSDYFEILGNWQLWFFFPQEQAHVVLDMIRPECSTKFEDLLSPHDIKSEDYSLEKDSLSYTVHFANLIHHQFIDELQQTKVKDGSESYSVLALLKASNITSCPTNSGNPSDSSKPVKWRVNLTKETDINSSRYTIGTYVVLSPMKSSSTLPISVIGKIVDLCRQPTNILLEIEEPIPLPLKLSAIQSVGHWQLTLIGNVIAFKRSMKAIKKLYNGKLNATKLLPFLICPHMTPGQASTSESSVPEENGVELCKAPLNESQGKAVAAAINQDITLIHGPPGTGKTHTATEIVRQMLLKYSSSKKKILVAAETNMAVDNLTRKLLQMNVMVIRVGNIEHISPDIRHVSLKHQSERKLRELGKYPHKNSYTFVRDILNSAEVVATTCTGVGESDLKNMKFSFVLIDEATQATEPVSLIPLVHQCEQLVLIGDPQQLPPTLINTNDTTKELSVSLFHRLHSIIPSFFLDIQHRMHPALADFPSNTFYSRKLKSDPGLKRTRRKFDSIWQGHSRLVFINVTKSREQCYGKSYQNIAEAEMVVDVISKLLINSVQQSEIVVLTPYAGQVKCIIEKLEQVAKFVEVSTIDGFQGQEKEIVIFSTVRTKSLGFTGDKNRMNVLLTRAKHGIIGIGCYNVLTDHSLWSEWLKQVQITEHFLESLIRSGSNVPKDCVLQICKFKSGKCKQGIMCKYAHSHEELKEWQKHNSSSSVSQMEKCVRISPRDRKLQICKFLRRGCKFKEKCRYAHSDSELKEWTQHSQVHYS